jgi:hypothetical protein
MKRESKNTGTNRNVLSPEIFLPFFVLGFYFVGVTLVQFSLKALLIVLLGVGAYLLAVRLTGGLIDNNANIENTGTGSVDNNNGRAYLQHDYFERLLLSLLLLFIIDQAIKGFLPLGMRIPLYLVISSAVFFAIGKRKIELSGRQYLLLGLLMILTYMIPAFAKYGLYGSYLNRTGGLMPAFLVGMGTITTVYGLMKTALHLTAKNLFIMIAAITVVAGPLMAALIGYRAYAIIYILPLIFFFIYTYFATSVARGAIYMFAPLNENAPAFVVESMESGHYTDKDMRVDNAEARNKFITRPFFTYRVFLDVIETSYPWGKSHGKLIVSLMPGTNNGRAATISILKKPLSTSFFGLSFLEFGLAGVAVYGALLGCCLAFISRFRNRSVYALILTLVMLWLDTGPSVWWHWLPFATAFPAATAVLFRRKHSRLVEFGHD